MKSPHPVWGEKFQDEYLPTIAATPVVNSAQPLRANEVSRWTILQLAHFGNRVARSAILSNSK